MQVCFWHVCFMASSLACVSSLESGDVGGGAPQTHDDLARFGRASVAISSAVSFVSAWRISAAFVVKRSMEYSRGHEDEARQAEMAESMKDWIVECSSFVRGRGGKGNDGASLIHTKPCMWGLPLIWNSTLQKKSATLPSGLSLPSRMCLVKRSKRRLKIVMAQTGFLANISSLSAAVNLIDASKSIPG